MIVGISPYIIVSQTIEFHPYPALEGWERVATFWNPEDAWAAMMLYQAEPEGRA